MRQSKSLLLASLIKSGESYSVSRSSVILSSDRPGGVFLIDRGYVKRYLISNQGSIGVQIIYGPGDIFSLTHIFKTLFEQSIYDGPEIYHYEAMSDLRYYNLSTESFTKAVTSNHELYQELFSEAGWHLKTCIHIIENISRANSYVRVAHQLQFFAKNFGTSSPRGIKIDIPLTHQDIADILSVTRETVSQSMTKLKKTGLIKGGRHIIIPNLSKLESEAYA